MSTENKINSNFYQVAVVDANADVTGLSAGSITATISANLGTVTAVTITGGSNGQVLTTNGSGSLSWSTPAASGVTSIDVSGGTTGLTTVGGPITSSGTITITGTLAATSGGTGQSTYAGGDILYASGVNTLAKRTVGSDGQVLTVSTGLPVWASLPANVSSFSTSLSGLTPNVATSGAVTLAGTLGALSGGTSQSSYATGDILYASNTNTLSKLGIGATGTVLTVSGGVPSWAAAAGGATSWPNGTVAAPGWPNTVTTSTGIYSTAPTTTINFAISGREAFRITGSATSTNTIAINSSNTGVTPTITNVGSDTSGAGLGITINARNAVSSNAAGAVSIIAGNAVSSSGGGVTITAGNVSSDGTAGSISLAAGTVGSSALGGGAGGNITFTTGGQTATNADSIGGYPGSFTFTIGRPGGRSLRVSSVAPSWAFNNTTPFGNNLAEANGLGGSNFIISCSDGQSTQTTSSGVNRNGGKGGSFTLTCGAGGAGTNPGTGTADGGAGGDFTVTCGAGGTGSKNVFGVGGGITFTPGRSGGGSSAAGSFSVLSPAASSAMVIAGTAGTGSSIVLNAGPGANNTAAAGTTQGGIGGTFTSALGNGGTASATSGAGTGGKGGSYSFTTGNGGNGSASGTPGAGGDYSITLGNAGLSAGNAAAGQFTVVGGTATGTGAVSQAFFNSVFVNLNSGTLGRGAPATKTGDFTVGFAENWIICNKVGSDIVVTLPDATRWAGREIMLKNIGFGNIQSASANVVPLTSSTTPGNNITGGTSGATAWATLVSDGTNWIIMQA